MNHVSIEVCWKKIKGLNCKVLSKEKNANTESTKFSKGIEKGNPRRITITYHRDIHPIMIVKCNYSERSNSLQQQICNGHLYRLLSKEGKHFEPHPSGAETNKYGRKDLLTIAVWPHHQLLAHKMFLSEPTHIHPFILFMQEKNINKYFPMWW